MVLKSTGPRLQIADIPAELRVGAMTAAASAAAATSNAASGDVRDLLRRMLDAGESFWSTVYAQFISRDLRREELKAILKEGLERTGGNYRLVVRLFNMPDEDYKRFLNFLRTYGCHLPYRSFRVDVGSARSMRVA
jgi:hypothetical protein